MATLSPIHFERNESVYSLIARVHRLTGSHNPLRTLTTFTGIRGHKPLSGLPTHLNKLITSLHITKSVTEIIRNHTHYPLYEPFVKILTRPRLIEAMSDSGAVKSILGLLRNHVGSSEALQYCNACLLSDFATYGFPYWRREHHLPWMYLCPHHLEPLMRVDLNLLDYGERALILPSHGRSVRCPSKNSTIDMLLNLGSDSLSLLNRSSDNKTTIDKTAYHRIFREIGLCSDGGHIRQKQLFSLIKDWLKPVKQLAPFNYLYDSLNVERSWVASVPSDKINFHHPLKHLIILKALNLTLDDLFLATQPYRQESLSFKVQKYITVTDEDIQSAIKQYGSIRQAAKFLRIDVTTLCCEANRLNIPYRRRTQYITTELKNEVIRYALDGISSTNIAKKLKISVSSVNRIERENFPRSKQQLK